MTIIVATAVLHNLALSMDDVDPPPIPEELNEHELNRLIEDGQIPDVHYVANEPVGAGAQLIKRIYQQLFCKHITLFFFNNL
jgi:hypothetical protein